MKILPPRPRTLLAAVLMILVVLAGCQAPPRDQADAHQPLLLLISIDGFRHDYFDRFDSPHLDRLIEEGLHADSLYHVFPTKTFPTHYSIVTGRHPGTHGVVANSMWDPVRDARFSLGNREAVGDGFWYQGGEPIWVTAQNQGQSAATYFWPGSEARIHRIRPDHWKPYSSMVPHGDRVEQLLEWASMEPGDRPSFMTLYFSVVDTLGHGLGPDADEVFAAAAQVDAELGELFAGLESLGLYDDMHIILVSDHGMTDIDIERYIMLDDFLDLDRVLVSDWGPAAQIWATDMPADEIVATLSGAHPRMRVWTRENIPARYRFGSHRRVPDVLAEADPGWMISESEFVARRPPPMGMHGWDPAWGEMHGIFVIRGPEFAPGSTSPAVRSVDLYALMTELLGLVPAEHEGTLAPFAPYLSARQAIGYRTLYFACDPAGPVEVRIGPAHMSLHLDGYIHVLDRVAGDTGLHFAEVDRVFEIDGDIARGSVDGNDLGTCRLTH